MNKSFYILIALLVCSISSFGQHQNGVNSCSQHKIHSLNSSSWLLESPNSPKHSFDVVKYTLYMDIRNCYYSPYPNSYTANENLTFVVDSTLNSINLNAVNTSLVIDSITTPSDMDS